MTIKVHGIYRMRCGEMAYVEGADARGFWGRPVRYSIALQWDHSGQCRPVGGESPMDLILGAVVEQERAA